ncbi:lipoprotein [Accumulibacter sp.]|uniref:lipoprotein n=1 Tax=Accumulibacter sp. TaxID=2053492 RepID=UPI00338D6E91
MRLYLALAFLATITLGGCGNRGGLTLPPKPVTATTPVAPTAVPSPTTATSAKDPNTARDPAQ